MNYLTFVLGFAVEVLVRRLVRPHSAYTKLAVVALTISGGALITPFWQPAIAGVFSSYGLPACDSPLPSLVSGFLFLGIAFVFAVLTVRSQVRQQECLVETTSISEPLKIGPCEARVFCGSVLDISGVDVVVTSENTDLNLGSISGTSLSGRMRRLAAVFDSGGRVVHDPLEEDVDKWKAAVGHSGPYKLGLCVPASPYNAETRGVRAIIHAITLEKRGSGINLIDERANKSVVEFAIRYCKDNGFTSVFFPIFGLGSGSIDRNEAFDKTLRPLIESFRHVQHPLRIYIGVYRVSDAALLAARLLRAR